MTRNPVGDNEAFSAVYWSSMYNALNNEAIRSGCTPTAGSGNYDIDIASGTAFHGPGSTPASVSSGTVTLNSSSSNDRIDLVHVTSGGTLGKTTGTAATDPKAPDIPSDKVLICAVLVPGGASSVTSSNIRDYRALTLKPTKISDLESPVAGSDIDTYSTGSRGNDIVDISTEGYVLIGSGQNNDAQLDVSIDGNNFDLNMPVTGGSINTNDLPVMRFENNLTIGLDSPGSNSVTGWVRVKDTS